MDDGCGLVNGVGGGGGKVTGVTVIEGDCLATLRTLPSVSHQCCVTSPPYYGLRDYGMAGQIGLEPSPDEYVARMVDVFREVRRVLRDDGTLWLNIGDSYARNPGKGGSGPGGKNAKAYGAAYGGAQAAVSRPGSSDGVVWRGSGTTLRASAEGAKPKDLLMIPATLALALRADGWFLRSDIIWHKPNPIPESVTDRPTSAHEHVFLLTKSARYFYDASAIAEECSGAQGAEGRRVVRVATPKNAAMGLKPTRAYDHELEGGRNARNVWTIATQPYSGAHFATMPPDLAERCIKAGTSERGQCPHCGSPWTRLVGEAIIEGRRDSGGVVAGADAGMYSGRAGSSARPTLGWSPSCDCPTHQPVAQHVLDPFGGAGTTGLVADRLGRSATLCELNPEYARLARERITADGPLLAVVA